MTCTIVQLLRPSDSEHLALVPYRGALVADFLAYTKYDQRLSPNTTRNYEFDIAKFNKWLEPDIPWAAVTRQHLRSFLQHLDGRGLSVASQRRTMACLKSFFRFMRIEGHIVSSPVDDMPKMKIGLTIPRYLEWDDIEKLIRAPLDIPEQVDTMGRMVHHHDLAGRFRDHAIMETLAASGVRISEVLGLEVKDLFLDANPAIRVLGKGNKERVIPIHERAVEALRTYLREHRPKLGPTSALVFISRGGAHFPRERFYYQVKRYAKQAGITVRVHPHMIRHSFASELVRRGCGLEVVQQLLGHSNIATTSIYLHTTSEHLRTSYLQYHPASH